MTAYSVQDSVLGHLTAEDRKRIEDMRPARARFDATVNTVRRELEAGGIRAFVLEPTTGDKRPIATNFWASDAAPVAFELDWVARIRARKHGPLLYPGRTPAGIRFMKGTVLADLSDVERLIQEFAPIPAEKKQETRNGTPKDAQEFQQWADTVRAETQFNPSEDESYNEFANPRGLSRDWVREQRKTLPAKFNRPRGAPKRKTRG